MAIAVTGIACRFPGARSPQAFWDNLCAGRDSIVEVPAERFDVDEVFAPQPGVPGRTYCRWGGFIEGIDELDLSYFGLSPREAERMDPQQRLLLEAAADALHDSLLTSRLLRDARAGVYVGSCYNDWEAQELRSLATADRYTSTGATRGTLATRLAFAFDLTGPALMVDVSCASSLLAIHLACRGIWSGETDLALAAGANLVLDPNWAVCFSQTGMLAKDGRCKAFDARADGFVRADGCGVVVLMSLEKARRHGLPVYALIQGSATTQDGRGDGLLNRPTPAGQAHALRAAYRDANVDPHDVQYIECHGSGTPAGDPAEVEALNSVMDGRAQPCLIGSVKTNIGHTEGAAGVAGFIKTTLALHHRRIPASIHCEEPNPAIAWTPSVALTEATQPWPAGIARAGVTSLGFCGTNVHVVLEQASQAEPGEAGSRGGSPLASGPPASSSNAARRGLEGDLRGPRGPRTEVQRAKPSASGGEATFHGAPSSAHGPVASPRLLCLSAGTARGLVETARTYAARLEAQAPADFREFCRSAALGRDHGHHRLAVVARDRRQAVDTLLAFSAGEADADIHSGRAAIKEEGPVFVFSGHGSQWEGMGAHLLQEQQVFRQCMERCDEVVRSLSKESVLDALRQHSWRDGRVASVQPLLSSIQIALAAQLRAWGVHPAAVVGHSLGEIAAAHVAGALSLEQALTIVCQRSAVLDQVAGQGSMLAVELDLEAAQALIAPYCGRVDIAVSNSESSTVLSGASDSLAEIQTQLQARGVFARSVAAAAAGHSPQLDPLLEDFGIALGAITPNHDAAIPIYSTVTGARLSPAAFDASHWAKNLRQPVRFAQAFRALRTAGHGAFVELSAHPILLGPMQQMLQGEGRAERRPAPGVGIATLRRQAGDSQALLAALAELYVNGQEFDLHAWFGAPGPHAPLSNDLPGYCWQREPIPRRKGAGALDPQAAPGQLPTRATEVAEPPSPGTGAAPEPVRVQLLSLQGVARQAALETYLADQVRRAAKLSSTRELDPRVPLTRLGLDSLLALEFKNAVETDLELELSLSKVLLSPGLENLALHLLDALSATGHDHAPAWAHARVAALDDSEVDLLLAELLEN